jgi:hypothetical protein
MPITADYKRNTCVHKVTDVAMFHDMISYSFKYVKAHHLIMSTELVRYSEYHPCICLDTDKELHADKVVQHYVEEVCISIRHCPISKRFSYDRHIQHTWYNKCSNAFSSKFLILGVTLPPTLWLKQCFPLSFINCLSQVEPYRV